LWLHALRQQGVAIRLRTFVGVGALVTVPSLIVSLAVLWALP
jgi:Na+/H+ antiporter NhaD/arsenite permease-like protein